jgi:hypothetical protein
VRSGELRTLAAFSLFQKSSIRFSQIFFALFAITVAALVGFGCVRRHEIMDCEAHICVMDSVLRSHDPERYPATAGFAGEQLKDEDDPPKKCK